MTYVLDSSVINEINRLFGDKNARIVKQKLASKKLPMEDSAPPSRVHIAILWLSKGDLKKFENELENASCDWRDTLVSAGLGDEDWMDVLKKKGIDCREW